MRKKALVFVLLAVAFACIWILVRRSKPEQRIALAQREAATHVLGGYIAEKFPRQKVLIASNPFTEMRGRPREIYEFEAAGLAGLREGFDDKISYKIVFPELRPGAGENPENLYVDPQTSTPLSFLVADDAFDQLFRANPEYEICVSLIGLPAAALQTDSWRKSTLKYALLLPDWRLIGNAETIRNAFKSGKIVAAVVNRPDPPPESKSSEQKYQMLFEQHFLLITDANCDELMKRYRRLF